MVVLSPLRSNASLIVGDVVVIHNWMLFEWKEKAYPVGLILDGCQMQIVPGGVAERTVAGCRSLPGLTYGMLYWGRSPSLAVVRSKRGAPLGAFLVLYQKRFDRSYLLSVSCRPTWGARGPMLVLRNKSNPYMIQGNPLGLWPQ